MASARLYAIPNDWDAENDAWVSVIFCVPNSAQWRQIVFGAINAFSYGRLWDGNTGNIRTAQNIGRQIEETIKMGCMEELVAVLANLSVSVSALANSATASGCCGGGSGGVGAYPPQSPLDPLLPPGFTDAESYAIYKCKAAIKIYNDLLTDAVSLSVTGVAGLLITAITPILITVLLTPVPFDDIVVLALLLLQLVIVGAQWADALDALDVARHDILCAMMESSSALDAVTRVESIISAGLSVFNLMDDVINTLVTIDAMNALFIPLGFIDDMPMGNCSCEDCIPGGTLQFHPTHCVVGDGGFSVAGNVVTMEFDVDTGSPYFYRYIIAWDVTWPPVEIPSRIVLGVTVPEGFDGTTANGRLQLLDSDGVDIFGPIGFAEQYDVNGILALGETCVAIIAVSHARIAGSVEVTLGETP